jgi:Holliday junction DNA helicase RuvB
MGRDALVRRFDVTARARRLRGEPFPHVLLAGAPGMGKTSIARGLAALLGGRLHDVAGPLLFDKGALLRLLLGMREGDVLFLDEVHGIPRPVLEVLYGAMQGEGITLPLRAGSRRKTVCFVLPRFTLIAATTEPGSLPDAFTSRCGLVEHLAAYRPEELARILEARAKKAGRPAAPGAARTVADASTGTPRDALRRMEQVVDEAVVAEVPRITRDFAAAALGRLGFSPEGLWPVERAYVDLLPEGGQAVSLGRIAQSLGLDTRAVSFDVEPRLLRRQLVRVTPQGRVRGAQARPARRVVAAAANGALPGG